MQSNDLTIASSKRISRQHYEAAQIEFENAEASLEYARQKIDAINAEFAEVGRRMKAAEEELNNVRTLHQQATSRLIAATGAYTGNKLGIVNDKLAAVEEARERKQPTATETTQMPALAAVTTLAEAKAATR